MIKLTPEKPPYYEYVAAIKYYKGLITQAGTAAPTIIILQNTLTAPPVITRAGTGEYLITLANEFPEEKTTFKIQNNGELQTETTMYWVDANTIGIGTGVANTPADDKLSKTPIDITVYN